MLNYKFYTLEKSKLDLELTFLMGLKLESNFKSKTQLGIGTRVHNFYCKFQFLRQVSVIFKQTCICFLKRLQVDCIFELGYQFELAIHEC
jgi:hypothetical protein